MYCCNYEPRKNIRTHVRSAFAVGMLVAALAASPSRAADAPIRLEVVGGLAAVSQYTKFEAPFWTHEVPLLTQGRVQAEIHPFDQSGLPGPEMTAEAQRPYIHDPVLAHGLDFIKGVVALHLNRSEG